MRTKYCGLLNNGPFEMVIFFVVVVAILTLHQGDFKKIIFQDAFFLGSELSASFQLSFQSLVNILAQSLKTDFRYLLLKGATSRGFRRFLV